MILSGISIRKLGIITPHYLRIIQNGVSYGESFAGYDIRLAEDVVLSKGYTTLGVSLEHFNMPTNVIAQVCDKSTWARKGVAVQNTIIEPGWRGHLTLELTYSPLYVDRRLNVSTTVIHAGTPIAQVIFMFVDRHVTGYEGKYQDQPMKPIEAKFE